jgi:hypothetical protein
VTGIGAFSTRDPTLSSSEENIDIVKCRNLTGDKTYVSSNLWIVYNFSLFSEKNVSK